MTDNCAANVFQLGGGLVSATETCLLRRIDKDNLDTGDKIDLSSVVNIASGRPLVDANNGDVYNLAATFLTGLKYHFVRFPYNEAYLSPKDLVASAKIVGTISSRMTTCFSYYHSFGMTDRYLVMIEQAWIVNSVKLAASKIRGLTFKDCLDWCPDEKNLFHIMDKSTGQEINAKFKYISDPFFFLNMINCFEDEAAGNLIVDVLAYDSPDILDQMYLEKLRSNKFENKDKSKILRFVLPLNLDKAGDLPECSNLVKDDGGLYGSAKAILENKTNINLKPNLVSQVARGGEHPKVNGNFQGRKYEFCYVIGWLESVNKGHCANAITKVNMKNGETLVWRANEFSHPCEVAFIPKAKDGAEDDGLIVASVTDVRDDQKDFLVFLDPKTMTELGRASFDESIPFSTHVYWNSA